MATGHPTSELSLQLEEQKRENQALLKVNALLRAAADAANRRAELAEASARRAWSVAFIGRRP